MLQLSQRISSADETTEESIKPKQEKISAHPDLKRLQSLMEAGDSSEAFFLARRLVSQGEDWAEEWVQRAKENF